MSTLEVCEPCLLPDYCDNTFVSAGFPAWGDPDDPSCLAPAPSLLYQQNLLDFSSSAAAAPGSPLPLPLPLPLDGLAPASPPACSPSGRYCFEPPPPLPLQGVVPAPGSCSPPSSSSTSSSSTSSPLPYSFGSCSDDSTTPPPPQMQQQQQPQTILVPQMIPPGMELAFLPQPCLGSDPSAALPCASIMGEAPQQDRPKRRRCGQQQLDWHLQTNSILVTNPNPVGNYDPAAIASTSPVFPTTMPVVNPPPVGVKLPRSMLLKMSTGDILEYARSVSSTRVLTTEEIRDLKKQKRMVRNRESAQLSRQRKREQVEQLEEIVRNLSNENDALKKAAVDMRTQLSNLQTENDHLKKQIAAIEAHVSRQPPTAHSTAFSSKRIKVTGVALMLVLFVFGLGMHQLYGARLEGTQGNHLQQAEFFRTNMELPVEDVRVSRILLEEKANREERIDFDAQILPVTPKSHLLSSAERSGNALVLSKSANRLPPNIPQMPPDSLFADPDWTPKNMTYLVAENVVRFDPPWATPNILFDEDPSFALLLPYSSLNRSGPASITGGEIVEVTCTVIGVSLIPQNCLPKQD
ncbi:cyclic AMP-responsive element-binding protein 3 [Pelomyxa schiedti]|nr:cyclic AMP-responsive element-binding protein 3 [Pelomyxa schiedti]